MCLGLTATYDGAPVLSTHTADFQQLTLWLTASARNLLPSTSFTSIQVNVGFCCQLHADANNEGNSIIVGFGQYTGGQLWKHDPQGTTVVPAPPTNNPAMKKVVGPKVDGQGA